MNCVAITGTTGFIGSHLAAAFSAAGWRVEALERPHYDVLASQPPALSGVDVLIHCARAGAQGDAGARANLAGAVRLFAAARAQGVGTVVFVSSLLASPASCSAYGREKSAIEALLDPTRDIVLRPGLVVGAGGGFGAMARSLLRFRAAPVVGDGLQPVYTIAVADLAAAVLDIVTARAPGMFLLAFPEPIPLRRMYASIAERAGIDVKLLPVPYFVLLSIAVILERLGLSAALSPERIRGLQNLRRFDIPRYAQIRSAIRPFDLALADVRSA